MPKVFFMSYARDDNSDAKLGKAVQALSERVAAKLGMAASDASNAVFFDVEAIRTGQDWEQRLGDAVRNTPILVCLCSPTYLSRAHCAKEFEVFRRRLEAAGAAMKDKVAIIPVIWEPGAPRMVLPEALLRFQWRDERLPKSYGSEGLSQLARFPSQREKYLKTIEYLAESIGDAHAMSSLPDLPGSVKFEDLPLWFQNPQEGPYNLRVIVLHANGTQWKPKLGGASVGAVVDGVSGLMKMAWEEIQPGPTLEQDLRKADAERQVSLLIVDQPDVVKVPWSAYLKAVDEAALQNCAVIVGLPPSSDPSGVPNFGDLATYLRAVLPNSYIGTSFHDVFRTDDTSTLGFALTRAATRVRAALVAADPPTRVEDAALTEAARSEGIPIETRPVILGPAGRQL